MPLGLEIFLLITLLAGAAMAAGTAWGRYRNLPPILACIGALLAAAYLATGIAVELLQGARAPAATAAATPPALPPELVHLKDASVAQQFTLRTVNFIPVGRVTCLEAARQAQRHAEHPERWNELMEVTLHICRQVKGPDRVVTQRLATVYLALGARVQGDRACAHYREARRLFAGLAQRADVARVDLLRTSQGCR
jgi:hypothetical protein